MTRIAELPRERLAGLRLLVLDVDGVLTDGGIVYSDAGAEIKRFHVRDGSGIKYWCRAGHRCAFLSGRASPVVERRAAELGVGTVRLGAKVKLPVFREILEALQVTAEETIYVGDDLPDLPPMREAGLAVAVAGAVAEVRDAADAATEHSGGDGAVREVVEAVLQAQGRWDGILERYRATDAGDAS
jgi:YrbI family 3-deoxy-D-manno-octulosonate 8-phosphate phosphatase